MHFHLPRQQVAGFQSGRGGCSFFLFIGWSCEWNHLASGRSYYHFITSRSDPIRHVGTDQYCLAVYKRGRRAYLSDRIIIVLQRAECSRHVARARQVSLS
jgi:hypothetical protein